MTRPYEPLGMTTQRWVSEVPVRRVRIEDLEWQQDGVVIRALLAIRAGAHEPIGRDPYPHVVRWEGRLLVDDGHHRLIAAVLQGEETAEVRVLEPVR